MKQSWQKTVRAGAEHVPVLAESRKLSPKKWQTAIPPVSEFMKAVQKDGSVLCAEDIFKTTWTWLRERRCDHLVPTQIIEQYAMAAARWVQCEEYVSTYGFLAKRANGSVANSPYVNISREYMKQANNIWYQIYQVVKENCTVELSGTTPQDDVMERLLRVRRGI